MAKKSLKLSRLHILLGWTVLEVCDLYEPTLLLQDPCLFFPGVTRKQLGLAFLGETVQDFSSLVGDVCLEVEGIDREVPNLCPLNI